MLLSYYISHRLSEDSRGAPGEDWPHERALGSGERAILIPYYTIGYCTRLD